MPVPHPTPISGASYSAVELRPDDDAVILLDQRRLPQEEKYVELRDAASVAEAIRDMIVRGAPAIGVTAAYALAVEAKHHKGDDGAAFRKAMERAGAQLVAARPTAVNLSWAVWKISQIVISVSEQRGDARAEAVAKLAREIHREDVLACKAMGAHGASLLPDEVTILTHCNAGALATGGYGSALGVVRAARDAGKRVRVLADETRPYLQGARLTAWELSRDGIPVEIITDGMAGYFFSKNAIDVVVVGADRVARNGDVANKIGTYGLACLARVHDRPFMVVAPSSTLDAATPSGSDIVIEERSSDEVLRIGEMRIGPANVTARHPAFDVTPARLVSWLVTERGAVAGVRACELMEP